MRDNESNQSLPAYENGPKEVNTKRGMPDGNKQFGKHKMPQDSKPATKAYATKAYVKQVMKDHNLKFHSHGRHKEHR